MPPDRGRDGETVSPSPSIRLADLGRNPIVLVIKVSLAVPFRSSFGRPVLFNYAAARGLDGLSYFVLCKLNDEGVKNGDAVCKKVREAFVQFPNWRRSQNELRELRQKVTFAIFAEEDNLDTVSALVDSIFSVLQRTGGA